MNNIENFLKEIKVYDCGLTKIRLGGPGDGGYVVLQELCEKTSQLITVGVGDDVKFELDFMKRFDPRRISLYDPTIERISENNPKLIFHRKEFSQGLAIVLSRSLLKIDIEWNEWDLFKNFSSDFLEMFDQILVEFHLIHAQPREGLSPYFSKVYQHACDKINQELFSKYCSVLKKLNEVFVIYHIHANNSLPKIIIEEDVGHPTDYNGHPPRERYLIPPLLEVSFVHKSLAKNIKPFTGKLPVNGLDLPNKSDRPDIFNWYPIC